MAIESNWNELPNDILNQIFFFLDDASLMKCLGVNKKWNQAAGKEIEELVKQISTITIGEASTGKEAVALFRSVKLVKSNYGLIKMIKKIITAVPFGKNIKIQCFDYRETLPRTIISIKSNNNINCTDETIYLEGPMDDALNEKEEAGFTQTVETEYVNNIAVKVDVIFPKGEPFGVRQVRGGPFGDQDPPRRGINKQINAESSKRYISYFSNYLPSDEKNPVSALIETSIITDDHKLIARIEELLIDKLYSWKGPHYEIEKAWLQQRAIDYKSGATFQ